MDWLIPGAAAAVIVIAVLALLRRPATSAHPSIQKRDFLLSPEERLFFAKLKQAVNADYEIFGRVPVSAVLFARSLSESARKTGTELWEQRYFSFVLCNKNDLTVVCAIVLGNHSSGRRQSEPASDPIKSACYNAGLPLVTVSAGPWYDADEIHEAIQQAVQKEPLFLPGTDGRREPRISRLENSEL
jgi:hypothetical protein